MKSLEVIALLTFALVILVMALAIPLARRWGWLDRRVGHKTHEGEVPLVGGLGLLAALWFAVLVNAVPWALTLGASVLFVLGALDDRRHLSPGLRFVVQAIVVVTVAQSTDAVLNDFGHLFSNHWSVQAGVLRWPLTVFCYLGVINAMNLIDGMDGLAGAVALAAVVATAVAAWMVTSHIDVSLLIFSASVVAFLMFNAPWRLGPRVFLGNGGSALLGLVLAWLLVRHSQGANAWYPPVAALWFLALPLIDTVSTLLRRLARGVSPFSPGHDHVHHLVLRRGFSVNTVWLLLSALASLLAAFGLLLVKGLIAEALGALFFVLIGVAYHLHALGMDRRELTSIESNPQAAENHPS